MTLNLKTYNTVAEMVAAPGLVVGDTVRTLGYLAAGDDGGNLYDIVAAATGTADGGRFINLTGSTGVQARGQIGRVIDSAIFGGVRSATQTAANTAIAAAIAYADTTPTTVATIVDSYNGNIYARDKSFFVNKGGKQATFDGEGNFRVNLDVGAVQSFFQLTASEFRAESLTDATTGGRVRARANGLASLRTFAGAVLRMFDIDTTRARHSFEDGTNTAMIETRPAGEILIGSDTGTLRLTDELGNSIMPLPIDSDGGDYYLRMTSTGQLVRSNPNAFRTQTGATAPVDGTDVAYYRGQLWVDRSTTPHSLYFADVKSTDPDVSAAGSVWVKIVT